MEKDSESCMLQQQVDGQFRNAESLKLSFDSGLQNNGIPCAVPCTGAIPSNCFLPAFGVSGLPDIKLGCLEPPRGWFYCLPQFRHCVNRDLTPSDKLVPKTNLAGSVPSIVDQNCGEYKSPVTDKVRAPKQFLVFDHSGNKTTMIFSSGVVAPTHLLSSPSPKDNDYYHASGDEIELGSNGNYHSGPNLTDELGEDHQTDDDGSEMHEDTDEINALLYSDGEDNYSEGEQETSTGHSPSTMTAYEKHDWSDEDDMDEVASSAGPVKRQKLSDNSYKVLSATAINTASSVKLSRSSVYEDDAESSCAGGKYPMGNCNLGSLSGNKRSKKEKIRDTVSILQTIIPGGKGKDAVMVLDEAINYLKALRFKAKSLGLSAF